MVDAGFLRRIARLVRPAIAALFDQSTSFGRLALLHVLQAAASSLVTISLAGSLFFSISPQAAKSKVLLYLLLTIAPFALVGPALSPLLDRGRQARRTSVVVANLGSGLLCLTMARNIHDLFLFPEAFGVLVLAKLYVVAKAALVPEMTGGGDDLASANAKLAVLASLSGLVAVPLGVLLLKAGAPWVLRFASLVFIVGCVAALRLPRPTRSARGDADASRSDRHPKFAEIAESRRVLGLPLNPREVVAGVAAMTIARATVGFVEFFLAFGLRRAHAPTYIFGLLILASAAGSLLGSMCVPRLRRRLSERQIIIAALFFIASGALLAGLIGGVWAQLVLTFAVGIGPMSAKSALDSIVQRAIPPALLGRTFGRIETRLQLVWVLASLLAVIIPFPFRTADAVVAGAAMLGALSYSTSRIGRSSTTSTKRTRTRSAE